jgi:hypothetical protein
MHELFDFLQIRVESSFLFLVIAYDLFIYLLTHIVVDLFYYMYA